MSETPRRKIVSVKRTTGDRQSPAETAPEDKRNKMADSKVDKSEPKPEFIMEEEVIPGNVAADILMRLKKLDGLDEKLAKLDKLDKIAEDLTTLTGMEESLNKLTTSVTNLETENQRLQQKMTKVETRCTSLENKCMGLNKEITKLKSENVWQEASLKKNNLILSGVEESAAERDRGVIHSVNRVLGFYMRLEENEVTVAQCYRIGPPPPRYNANLPAGGNRRPRPIMVIANTLWDRNRIWANKSKLKGSDYFISEDLPRETERKRALLVPVLKAARANDKYTSAYLVGDKLTIDKKKNSLDTIDQLPNDLNPRRTSTQLIDGTTYFFSRWSPLSNHNTEAPFHWNHKSYSSTEQYYFSAKASYLEDAKQYEAIMKEDDPYKVLVAGKKITDQRMASPLNRDWESVEMHHMTIGNRAKYLQNPGHMAVLLATSPGKLAECSATNSRWGIGFSLTDPEKTQHQRWGKNQMGTVLSNLRLEFQAQAAAAENPDQMEVNQQP
jgi:hypothetical protein